MTRLLAGIHDPSELDGRPEHPMTPAENARKPDSVAVRAIMERWAIEFTALLAENDVLVKHIERLERAATFKRNAIVTDDSKFVGEWIAVPREDFDGLVAALAATQPEEKR